MITLSPVSVTNAIILHSDDDRHFLNLNVTQIKYCCAGHIVGYTPSQLSCDGNIHAHKIRTGI